MGKPGPPQDVIESVQGKIRSEAFSNLLNALYIVVTKSIEFAAPGSSLALEIIDALKNAVNYIVEVFCHIRDLKHLKRIKDEAVVMFDNKLWTDPSKFQTWYKGTLVAMPLVACYCLAMPLTGHYSGFLSVLSEEGLPLSDSTLKRNKKDIDTVQEWAREFVQKHTVKLTSDNSVVKFSITIANNPEKTVQQKEEKSLVPSAPGAPR